MNQRRWSSVVQIYPGSGPGMNRVLISLWSLTEDREFNVSLRDQYVGEFRTEEALPGGLREIQRLKQLLAPHLDGLDELPNVN